MFGKLRFEDREGKDRMISPWEERLMEDLDILMAKNGGLRSATEWNNEFGIEFLWKLEWRKQLLDCDTTLVREYENRQKNQGQFTDKGWRYAEKHWQTAKDAHI